MQSKVCYLIGAGENHGLDFVPAKGDVVIAVDGGLRYLEQAGIPADMVIGDMDTLGFCPKHQDVILLQPEKDDTDMLAALKEGIKGGFTTFHIYGGTGGRADHTMANIQLLAFLAKKGMRGYLHGKDSTITAIADCAIKLPKVDKGFISIFSYTEQSVGVSLKGLKYELQEAVLDSTFPIGVSNEFIGKESTIEVKEGIIVIYFPKQLKEI